MKLPRRQFCNWQRAPSRCRPCRAWRGRKPIRRARSRWSCRSPRAARPIRSRASWPSACARRSASRSSSRTSTGAAGSIGVGRVARAAPDGYTLSIGHWSTHVVNGAIYPLPYDVLNDFEPIVAARDQSAADRREESRAGERSEGADRLAEGQPGQGVAGHRRRRQRRACRAASSSRRTPARASSSCPIAARPGDAGPGRRADRHDVRPGGRTRCRRCAPARSRPMPSRPRPACRPRPTSRPWTRPGCPGFYISVWHALWAPKGTPKDIIAKLNAAVVEALADPAVRAAARRSRPGDLRRASSRRRRRSARYHKAEIEKWWPIIKAANIKGE